MDDRFRRQPWAQCRAIGLAAVLLAVGCNSDTGSTNGPPGGDVGLDAADGGADLADAGLDADLADDTATTGDARADAQADGADGLDDAADADADAPPLALDLRPGCNPFATSQECFLPYPSAFFQVPDDASPTGVRLDYHNDIVELPPGTRPIDFTAFNAADGAPPAGPLLVHFGVDIDPDQLVDQRHPEASAASDAPIALFDLDTGEQVLPLLTEMDQNSRNGQWDGRYALIIRPLVPMAFGDRHVAVLTTALRDADGQPLTSPPAFAALRDGVITDSPEIEAVRPEYAQIFTFLEEHGYARQDLLLAWDFHVASRDYVLGSVLSMRQRALQDVSDHGVAYTIDSVQNNPNANVARLVEGTFEVPTFIDADNVIEYDDAHHPVLQDEPQSFPFTMVIPPAAHDGPLPLVVLGHGIFGNGRDFATDSTAQAYIQPAAAQAGAILIATDWIGLSAGDLDLIVNDVLPDLNHITVITDRLQQSLINTLVLTELGVGPLAADDQVQFGDGPIVDATQVGYFGASLGGIQGASFVSLSPRVQRAALGVPGCAWTDMINRSTVFKPIKQVADLVYPDPLLQQIFLALVQGDFDFSDPVNLSQLWSRDPLDDAPPGRIAVLQEAIGDALVPNLTTGILARTMGVVQITPDLDPIWGLDPATGPTTESALTQILLPDNLAEYTPPDTNVLPDHDNDVHFESVIQTSNLATVEHLLEIGEIEQFCEGTCDPD